MSCESRITKTLVKKVIILIVILMILFSFLLPESLLSYVFAWMLRNLYINKFRQIINFLNVNCKNFRPNMLKKPKISCENVWNLVFFLYRKLVFINYRFVTFIIFIMRLSVIFELYYLSVANVIIDKFLIQKVKMTKNRNENICFYWESESKCMDQNCINW